MNIWILSQKDFDLSLLSIPTSFFIQLYELVKLVITQSNILLLLTPALVSLFLYFFFFFFLHFKYFCFCFLTGGFVIEWMDMFTHYLNLDPSLIGLFVF